MVILLPGIVNLIVGLWLQGVFRYVNLAVGTATILLAIVYRKVFRTHVVRFEQDQIAGLSTRSHDAAIAWQDVSKMEATKSHLIIHRRGGEKIRMSLGNITVHQESEVLPKVIDLATSKGVEVEVAPLSSGTSE